MKANLPETYQSRQATVNSIGHNIRRLRQHRGMTLNELARSSSTAKATLSNLESGRGNPTLETLLRLADGLGFPLSDILAPQEATTLPTLLRGGELNVISGSAVDLRAFFRFASGPSVTEIYEMEVRVGARQESNGHPGTEHITVFDGRLLTGPTDAPVEVAAGDFVSFGAQCQHFYEALEPVRASLVIHYQLSEQVAPDIVRSTSVPALDHGAVDLAGQEG